MTERKVKRSLHAFRAAAQWPLHCLVKLGEPVEFRRVFVRSRARLDASALGRLRARVANLFHEEGGAAAIEYAIVLPFFLLVVFAIFQLGFAFITQELLDSAARDASRMIRIGTFTGKSSAYATNLKARVCQDLSTGSYSWVTSCPSTIQIYVAATNSGQPAGSGFGQLNTATVSNGTMTKTEATLGAKYDVILQIGYDRGWLVSRFSGNSMLVSTLVFQTEPY
jgi:Flp pilus assembly protein TadG